MCPSFADSSRSLHLPSLALSLPRKACRLRCASSDQTHRRPPVPGSPPSPPPSPTHDSRSGLAGATADVHCYDVSLNKWSRLTPLGEPPSPRAAHVATAVGTMVVIQGHETSNLSTAPAKPSRRFLSSPWAPSWVKEAPDPLFNAALQELRLDAPPNLSPLSDTDVRGSVAANCRLWDDLYVAALLLGGGSRTGCRAPRRSPRTCAAPRAATSCTAPPPAAGAHAARPRADAAGAAVATWTRPPAGAPGGGEARRRGRRKTKRKRAGQAIDARRSEEIFRFEARFSEVWKLLLILTNLSKEVWFNSALFVQARATGCLILIQFAGEVIVTCFSLLSIPGIGILHDSC
uniref:Uncharacterized protein n=1 Tax=Zea mays TaxID=4577 RepID=A0A804QC47_MAIZE